MYKRNLFILIPLLSIFIYVGTWSSVPAGQKNDKNDAQGATTVQKADVQHVESSKRPPPMAKISEKDFKFSPVVEGTTVHHNFIIKNEGKSTLYISKVKTG